MELICSAQALDQRGVDKAGRVARGIYQKVRSKVVYATADRSLSDEIMSLSAEVISGSFSSLLPFDII